jgi:hypothetical protein
MKLKVQELQKKILKDFFKYIVDLNLQLNNFKTNKNKMNQQVKTGLGVILIIIIVSTIAFFVWKM